MIAYVCGTVDVGLSFRKRMNVPELIGYVDPDFDNDRDTRKSNTAYFFTVGNNCISWKSQLQPLFSLSTTESEYLAIFYACNEVVWLQSLLKEACLITKNTEIFSDSQSAIHLSKNHVYHKRTKQVGIEIREIVSTDEVFCINFPQLIILQM